METLLPARPPEQALAVVPGFGGHPLHVLQIVEASGWWVLRGHGGLEESDGRFTSRWKVPAFALAFSEESSELVLVPFRLEDSCAVLDVKPIYADESDTRLEHQDDMQWCMCPTPMPPWCRYCPDCGGPRRSETALSGLEDRLDNLTDATSASDVRFTCLGPPAQPSPQRDRVVQLLPVEDGPVVRYCDTETTVVAWAVHESGATAPVIEVDHRPVVLRAEDDRYAVVR